MPVYLRKGCVFRNTGGFVTPEPVLFRSGSIKRCCGYAAGEYGGVAAFEFAGSSVKPSFPANRSGKPRVPRLV